MLDAIELRLCWPTQVLSNLFDTAGRRKMSLRPWAAPLNSESTAKIY